MSKGQALALRTPAKGDQASLPRTLRALVVEADYFALTDRHDDNIIFWVPGFARQGVPPIPGGVTHIWIAKHVWADYRIKLRAQARERGIEIWDCAISELIRRLLPFWADPLNRSLITPVQPDEDSARELDKSLLLQDTDDASPRSDLDSVVKLAVVRSAGNELEDEDEPLDRSREDDDDAIPKGNQYRSLADRRRANRLGLLRKAGAKAAAIKNGTFVPSLSTRPKPVKTIPARPTLPAPKAVPVRVDKPAPKPQDSTSEKSILAHLGRMLLESSSFDRRLFNYKYGLNDRSRVKTNEQVAMQFFVSVENVRDSLLRTWSRLAKTGFRKNEAWLLSIMPKD